MKKILVTTLAFAALAMVNTSTAAGWVNDNSVAPNDGIAIGNGTTTGHAEAYGDSATAVGPNSSAGGQSSVAVGQHAHSRGENSVAIGANSFVDENATDSVAVGNDSVADRAHTVSVGATGYERQVTNVADGTENTDAVNVGQLNQAKTKILKESKGIVDSALQPIYDSIDEGLDQAEKYTDQAKQDAIDASKQHTDQAITDNNVITDGKINSAKDAAVTDANAYTDTAKGELTQAIDDSAAATESKSNAYTDLSIKNNNAVTDGKIDTAKGEAIHTSNQYTDAKVDGISVNVDNKVEAGKQEAISTSKNYTDVRFNQVTTEFNQRFDNIENKVNKNADRANAGIASVAAMTNIPYTDNTTFSAGLGVGNYRNGKAIAAGAQYNVNDNVHVRASVSWNNEDSAVIGAGVGFGF